MNPCVNLSFPTERLDDLESTSLGLETPRSAQNLLINDKISEVLGKRNNHARTNTENNACKYNIFNFPSSTTKTNPIKNLMEKKTNITINPSDNCMKIEPNSCLMLLFIKRKHLADVICDYEFEYHKGKFRDIININPSSHESYFGLAKLFFYKNIYSKALFYIEKAIKISQSPLYNI